MRHLEHETRFGFYGTVFETWAIVAMYAILHDQYVVLISPEHFTVYHPNPLEIGSAQLLAAYLALMASIPPGLLLGVAMFLVGRLGGRPKVPVRSLLKSACVLVVVTEGLALLSLGAAWGRKGMVYPERFYPADAFSLVCAQTVQLTAYLVGFVGSGVLLGVTWWRRRKGPEDP